LSLHARNSVHGELLGRTAGNIFLTKVSILWPTRNLAV
jgi:hypothetical protein